jgi:hypothetical protein
MRLRTLARSSLVFVPLLLICAARVHAHRTAAPDRMTQELNRCLTVMRIAASRRKTATEIRGGAALAAKTDSAAAWVRQPDRHEKTA